MKVAVMAEPTHNPFGEARWASCLRENFTSSSYGEGLETGRRAPRQPLTRQVFHKILKSGCKVEESRLRTAPRLVSSIATCCVLAWRIFWMTMVSRTDPAAAPMVALTRLELDLLDEIGKRQSRPPPSSSLSAYIDRIARLGGYLGRTNDPPPGNIVMWRGLARLTDIAIGFSLNAENVGN